MFNRIQLMEGGDWTQRDLPIKLNIQTPEQVLKDKLRCYAILFDEVVLSAGDYFQSNSLYQAAQEDKPLWGKDGPIRIGVAEAIGDIPTYRKLKFGGPEDGMWLGAPTGSKEIVEDEEINIDRKVAIVDDLGTRIEHFPEDRVKEALRKEVIKHARNVNGVGMSKLADRLEKDARGPIFNRDVVIGTMREVWDRDSVQAFQDFFRLVNVCYYYQGASGLHAELGVHSNERRMDQVLAQAPAAGPPGEVGQSLESCEERIDNYVVAKTLVKAVFDLLGLDLEQALVLEPEPFGELICNGYAKSFREALRTALPPQGLRCLAENLDWAGPFRDYMGTVLGRERKWIKRMQKAARVTRIATHALLGVGATASVCGVCIPDPSWREAARNVAPVAAFTGYWAERIWKVASEAMRNRACPLLTFEDRAGGILRGKVTL
jgi:hypothetical protein